MLTLFSLHLSSLYRYLYKRRYNFLSILVENFEWPKSELFASHKNPALALFLTDMVPSKMLEIPSDSQFQQ
jgi:hypothetical protein